jgi:hypothetical protein
MLEWMDGMGWDERREGGRGFNFIGWMGGF